MKNKFRVENDIAYIEVFHKGERLETQVDIETLEELQKLNTTLLIKSGKGYVYFQVCGNNQRKLHYLHRWIMDAPKGKVVDHILHDKLDNRKSQMRVCTNGENNRNRKLEEKSNCFKVNGRYYPRLTKDGKLIYYGRGFDTLEEAIPHAEKHRQNIFGEFAGRIITKEEETA